MKKSIIWAMLAMLLPITQAWGSETKYDYYARAKVSKAGSGDGTVYISNSASADSGVTDIGDKNSSFKVYASSGSGKVTAYFYAQPASDSKFVGWTKGGTNLGMGDAGAANNRLTVTLTTSGTANATQDNGTWTANFALKENYSITYKCIGGTYKAGSETINADKTFQKDDNYTVTFSEPSPSPGYDFVGWCKFNAKGVPQVVSYKKTYSMTFTEAVTFGAYFKELDPLSLTIVAPEGGSCTYKVGSGDVVSMTSESEDAAVEGYGKVSISFTATPVDKVLRPMWYFIPEGGAKEYFSYQGAASFDFTEGGVVGVDFVQANPVLAEAIEVAKTNDTHTVKMTKDASIFDGTEMTIPDGVTIDMNGHALYVDGTLKYEGTGKVVGTVSQCTKLLKQTGNGLSPCNPYKDVHYWKTEPVTPQVSIAAGCTPASNHVAIVRGDGGVVRKVYTGNPTALYCSADAYVAANHITWISRQIDETSLSQSNCGSGESLKSSYQLSNRTADLNGQTVHATNAIVVLLQEVSLTGQYVDKSDSQDRYKYWGVIDCAGQNCKGLKYAAQASHMAVYINGNTVSATDGDLRFQNAGVKFVNCKSFGYVGRPRSNDTRYHFYDCDFSSKKLSFTAWSSGSDNYAVVAIYSGKYDYDFDGATASSSRIYGGAFKKKPADAYRSDSNYTFYQHDDDYWYYEESQDWNVATVSDGTTSQKVESFGDALAKLNTCNEITVTLLRSITLDDPITIPAGKTLKLDFGTCKITAPKGFAKNYGTLEIWDNIGRSSNCGIYSNGANVFENEAGGTIDICYGEYVGNIVVSGGAFTTHQGNFVGTISKGDSADLNLRGGSFSYDVGKVEGLLDSGYVSTLAEGGGKWWVGAFPGAVVESTGVGRFTVTAMSPSDLAIYRSSLTKRSDYANPEDWKYRAELVSSRAGFSGATYIDVLMAVDKDAEKGSIETGMGSSATKMYANQPIRVFSPQITQTQISYTRFVYDPEGKYNELSSWASSSQNKGTTCTLYFETWRYGTGRVKNTLMTIAKESFVFGMASNDKAMIVGSGDVTFKKSLAAAVSDVAEGGTVRLCQSCANESLTVTKPCTIDLNDFAVGTLTAGDGLERSEETMPNGRKGYVFTSAAKDCKLTVNAPAHVTAVTVQVVGGDVLTPEGNVYTVPNGASVAISYTMATGYDQIAAVTLNNLTDETKTVETPTAKATKYGIDYELNGGSVVDANPTTYTVEDNVTLNPLERAGYAFVGWCRDQDLTDVIDGFAIAQGTTGAKAFYAKWSVVEYGITYNLNGGENGDNPATYTIESEDIVLQSPTKEGYDFLGWFDGDDKVETIEQGSTGDLTLTAKWSPVPVSFKPVGGLTKVVVTTNGVEVLPDGDGYYTVYYGQSVYIKFKASRGYSVAGEEVVIDSMAYTVVWPAVTANQYTIAYVLDDGVENGAENVTGYTYPASIKLYAPTWAGHTFLGWYYDEDLTKKVQGTFVDDDGVTGTFIPGGAADNLTFYAKWENAPVVLTVAKPEHATIKSVKVGDVEIVGNGGEYTIPYGANVVVAYKADAGYGLSQTTVEIDGFTNATTQVLGLPTVSANVYQVGYELNGGTIAEDANPTSYTVETQAALVAPSRNGYDFGGWYEDAAFAKKAVAISRGSTGVKTFYACWLSKVATSVDSQNASLDADTLKVKVPENMSEQDLQKTADNGLKTWQNFARDAAGVSEGGTTVTVATNELSASASDVTVKIETSASVTTVAVVRVSSVTNATVDAVVAQKGTDDAAGDKKEAEIAVNYADLDAGIYRPAVVVTDDANGQALIPDVETPAIEVVKNTNQLTKTVLTVPFDRDVSGQPQTIASLIEVSSLSEGDTIKRYNKNTGLYDSWFVEEGELKPMQTTAGGPSTSPDKANETLVEAGQALIVERTGDSATNALTMVGQYAETVVTPIEQPEATTNEPVWNLVGNVDAKNDFDLNTIDTANAKDMIVVEAKDSVLPKRYNRGNDGKWSYTTNAVIKLDIAGEEMEFVQPVKVTDDAKVKGGGWFWYVSGGGDKETKIDWKKK